MVLKPQTSGGEGQLVAHYGVQRFNADWNNPSHRVRRLLAEFLGVAGLMVILSRVAAILARFAGAHVAPYQVVAIAAITSGAYLVAAIYFLGDMSAHFDPVVTLAFGIRRDMSWGMVVLYWIAQFSGAACGSLLIRSLVGSGNNLAATLPSPHLHLQAMIFEAVITFGLVLLGKADWEYVRNPARDDLFIPWGIHEQLSKNKLELLDHDGDIGGGLTALKLPGHTAGSMGVRFEHATNGTVVIAGDAIKNLNEVINGRQSNVQYQFPIAASMADDEASIAKVARMADCIIPGHFPELKREGTVFTPVGPQSLEIQFK